MKTYEENGVLSIDDLELPSEDQLIKGVAITECVQDIPCNPCVDACPVDAISMKDINAPPVVDYDRCIACGKCVGVCPGLAIFVVKYTDDKALVTLPYEFLPVPKKNEKVQVLDRKGSVVGSGMVKRVVRQGKTMVITVEVEKKVVMNVRNIQV
mgnify:CR=1 FL=1